MTPKKSVKKGPHKHRVLTTVEPEHLKPLAEVPDPQLILSVKAEDAQALAAEAEPQVILAVPHSTWQKIKDWFSSDED